MGNRWALTIIGIILLSVNISHGFAAVTIVNINMCRYHWMDGVTPDLVTFSSPVDGEQRALTASGFQWSGTTYDNRPMKLRLTDNRILIAQGYDSSTSTWWLGTPSAQMPLPPVSTWNDESTTLTTQTETVLYAACQNYGFELTQNADGNFRAVDESYISKSTVNWEDPLIVKGSQLNVNAARDGLIYQRPVYGTGTIDATGDTGGRINGQMIPYSFVPSVRIVASEGFFRTLNYYEGDVKNGRTPWASLPITIVGVGYSALVSVVTYSGSDHQCLIGKSTGQGAGSVAWTSSSQGVPSAYIVSASAAVPTIPGAASSRVLCTVTAKLD